ncbi:integrin alpha-8 [Orussus abietinus]|uniref:integrin alpha-8 n=1 Tax=Orussus abietinus TaxID=222816 RepID=UPI000C715FFD|nr:integrin alpha-8 [Orussus abietinus]
MWRLILLMLANCALAYNIDTDNVKLFDDPARGERSRGSYFGYSVALYTEESSGSRISLVLVGAPRANNSQQSSVKEPGIVFKCPVEIGSECKEWFLDNTKNGRRPRYNHVIQEKDNAWTGATIAIQNGSKPKVVVCAPRWKNTFPNGRQVSYMNGLCYWTTINSNKSFEMEATNLLFSSSEVAQQTADLSYARIYNFGMSEMGFSLHTFYDKPRFNILAGSPGVFNWKGVPILFKETTSGYERIIPYISDEYMLQGNEYFGYSQTSGYYFKDGQRLFASAAPRGAQLRGKVIVFSLPQLSGKKISIVRILEGEELGEYFGGALTTCDLNNDGRDDLIVGAPSWGKEIEEGRVYLFKGRTDENFQMQSFDGEVPRGRFGTTVTCLGDIDRDNYMDIAVGAPYENDHGAVYIFNGGMHGLPRRYSQKISGSPGLGGIRGFGISISEPRDIDGNGYLDFAVGAYLSGHVILFYSRPVVTLTVKVTYSGKLKLQANSTYFFIDVCTFYAGSNVPKTLNLTRILKLDETYGRVRYGKEKTDARIFKIPDIVERGTNLCSQLKLLINEAIQNVVDPIEIFVSLHLSNELEDKSRCSSCPVVNKDLSKVEDAISLPFAVDCGNDDICMTDLEAKLTTNLPSGDRFVIGSTFPIKLDITVRNRAEPAYQTRAILYIPEPLALGSLPPECTESCRRNGSLEVICNIDNPLRTSKTSVLELDASGVPTDYEQLQIVAKVITQSEEITPGDNIDRLTIYFDVDVNLAIVGKAQEDLYSYFHRDEEERLRSIRFQHIYEVQKLGVSPIEESVLSVLMPTHVMDENRPRQIVNVNETIGYKDGRHLFCTVTNQSADPDPKGQFLSGVFRNNQYSISNEMRNYFSGVKGQEGKSNDSEKDNQLLNVPRENRTLFINCTNPAVLCANISCSLGSFESSLSTVKLLVTLDLQLSNLKPSAMEGKDIIYYVSMGSVKMTHPDRVVQTVGDKYNNVLVATTFVGSPIKGHVALWVIVLSVFLGIVLLILLVLGLIKYGFFSRKKKMELEALMAETDKTDMIVLETSSSMEVLDQN